MSRSINRHVGEQLNSKPLTITYHILRAEQKQKAAVTLLQSTPQYLQVSVGVRVISSASDKCLHL